MHLPCAATSAGTQAGNATALITLAPSGSAALAAGRLASRWTILLNRSALSPSERMGGALCLSSFSGRVPPPLLSSGFAFFFHISSRLFLSSNSDLLVHLSVGLAKKGLDLLRDHFLPVVPTANAESSDQYCVSE